MSNHAVGSKWERADRDGKKVTVELESFGPHEGEIWAWEKTTKEGHWPEHDFQGCHGSYRAARDYCITFLHPKDRRLKRVKP